MRILSLRLTGRRPKPPTPDTDLATLKEQAQLLLEQPTLTTAGTMVDLTPRPAPHPIKDVFSFGPDPQPDYMPDRSRIQPTVKYPLFGSERTREGRPGVAVLPRFAAPWEVAWAHLTDAERAWSSGGGQ